MDLSGFGHVAFTVILKYEHSLVSYQPQLVSWTNYRAIKTPQYSIVYFYSFLLINRLLTSSLTSRMHEHARGHEWIVEFVFQTYMQLMDLRVRRVPVGRFPAPEVSVPLER